MRSPGGLENNCGDSSRRVAKKFKIRQDPDFMNQSRPDTPCIAICSTAQGDDICKGCGRTFEEVTNWVIMTQEEKDIVWRRIESQATALRFTTYKERAI
jgi:predicted Fe-S protein YdhL (DUF1289 family)